MTAERKCTLHPNHNLVKVDKSSNTAYFHDSVSKETISTNYDLLHAVPIHKIPAFIADSDLADSSQMLEIDVHTLQHKR